MNISVIGTSGSIGSEIVRQIVATRLLENNERLQLVGRMEGTSSKVLYELSSDLQNAYSEICPIIEVILNKEDISGDLIIMAAGMSAPVNKASQNISRNSLSKKTYRSLKSTLRLCHVREKKEKSLFVFLTHTNWQ